MNKKVGQLLKEVREEKGLSIKDVARDTNIAIKFVIALENEDYSQFPGETFTVGFLKTYSDYLKLDSYTVMNIYKGEQMSESSQPLQDILDPTRPFHSIQMEKNRLLPIILISVLVIGIGLFAIFYDGSDSNSTIVKEDLEEEKTPKPIKDSIPEITFVNQSVPENSSVPFMLTPDQGFTFSVANQQCKIFIKSVKKTDDKENIATIGFNIFPERKVYFFESKVGLESVLSFNNPELASLGREIKITTQAVTDNSAKILIKLGEQNKQGTSSTVTMGDVPISIILHYSKSTFSEFIIDGQTGESRVVPAGETRQLEARDRLEIKVMDGSAVEISQNGKEKTKLGKTTRYVKKIFQKVPNPLDSTQFNIRESGE